MKKLKYVALYVATLAAASMSFNMNANTTTIDINAGITHQTIDGFGASDAWSMDPLGKYWTLENKNKVADLLFSETSGIGLSLWRFNVGAGSAVTDVSIITNPWRRVECFKQTQDGNYDWTKQSGQQWFLESAKERGVNQFVAFFNSPPVWMTKNGHAQCDSSVGSTNLKKDYDVEFAKFAIDVVEHFKNEKGITFNYISPINEPTWDWNGSNQEGCRFNNDDCKAVYDALYAELEKKGLTKEVEIDGVEGVEMTAMLDNDTYKKFSGNAQYTGGSNSLGVGKYREYIKDFIGDQSFNHKLGKKIGCHSYWSDYSNTGDDRLGELKDLLRQNIDKYVQNGRFWMTEYCIMGGYGSGRDLGIDPALYITRLIHRDLSRANASAWIWWTAVSKEDYKDGLIYTNFVNSGDAQTIFESKILWGLGNYSKFIRPGSVRINCTGADDVNGLMASAYLDSKNHKIIIVLVNCSSSQAQIKFDLKGIPEGRSLSKLTPYITSSSDNLSAKPEISLSSQYIVPAKSIVTLVGVY